MKSFLISITKEDDFFIARCPELNVTSQGLTLEEAHSNIKEAIELYVESFDTEDFPENRSTALWTTVEISNV